MSSFFKQLFPFMKVKKKKEFSYINRGVDPNSIWSLVGELGDGSFGKVYKAERKTDGVLAAAKIIDVKDESELDDFMVEIDILSECKHSHVVGMYEAYYHENKLWMMLEFCSGGALDDLILELERGLTEEQIRTVCKQLFECLHFLHTHKVIHRDLKAGNLLLTNDGNIKLADFGVSAKNKKTIQRRTTFIGTPYWMAPEVIVTETCKDDPYDYKADIWSAGVTLIELAEMQPPYHDMHPMRVLFKIPKADPPTLQFKNKWSKDFHDFLSLCVVKSPEMRSSAAELLEHPFIANVSDSKCLKELYNEAKAIVIEELEDLPEDKEEREKNRLKAAESAESLDESVEWSSEIEKEGDEGEKEMEESTENEKEIDKEEEKEEPEEEKREEAKETTEDLEEKKEEEKKEEEKTEVEKEKEEAEERKEYEENKEEGIVKEEEAVEKKEVAEEQKESEVQEKTGEVEEKEEKGEEDKGEVKEIAAGEEDKEEAVEEKEEVDEKKEENEEEEQEEQTPKEEAVAEKEEDDDKVKEAEEKIEAAEKGEGAEEDKKEKVNEEPEKEEIQQKQKDDESPQPAEGGVEVPSNKNEVPAEEKVKETQEHRDKYSTRLDNILDQLEDDEPAQPPSEDSEPSVSKENQKQDVERKEEEKAAVQENEERKEEQKSEEAKETVNEGEAEETKDNEENKEEKEDENKTEDKEDDVFDANEKAPIPNGDVLIPVVSKEPPSPIEKKPETTDGAEEEKHFKTLKRIRKFEKDGKIVTETTSRVVDVSQEDYRNAVIKEQQQRKANLRELKVLQREEQKQGMLLMAKIRRQWDAQEQRFEQELVDLDKKYELDLDNLSRNQKKDIEKLELTQNADLRVSSRKMKQDQEKELKRFRDSLREEFKTAKKEVDQLPRNQRKESWRKKKEEMEVSQRQAEHEFLAMQRVEFEKFCKELIDLHRERMYNLEMQFLQHKHSLKRGHEGERWEIEQRQLHERHQLARTQLKETFFLQRSQMLNRHQKECDQHTRLTKLKEEEMKRRHEIERKRLPKIQRDEIKAKSQQYRKSLRIEKRVSMDIEREMMKEFELLERKKARSEYDKLLFRQEMEAEELRITSESALKELQQLQNEKRHMLMESETTKLKERDEKHQAQVAAWKAELGPRKKTLEEEFAREEREQQMFYARNLTEIPLSPETTLRESEGEPGNNQVDGEKTPEDNTSSKSSSGSMDT